MLNAERAIANTEKSGVATKRKDVAKTETLKVRMLRRTSKSGGIGGV
jgi:hypothetical protein